LLLSQCTNFLQTFNTFYKLFLCQNIPPHPHYPPLCDLLLILRTSANLMSSIKSLTSNRLG
jgi:hypothetical protein